jgi:putative transposase
MYYGPEFVSRAVLKWLTALNIDTVHIDPGKPWQNGTDESFNGKFRDECLSMEWFRNRIDAKITIEQFRRQYNEIRPHSSLGQLTPVEFKQKLSSAVNHGERTSHFFPPGNLHRFPQDLRFLGLLAQQTLQLSDLLVQAFDLGGRNYFLVRSNSAQCAFT